MCYLIITIINVNTYEGRCSRYVRIVFRSERSGLKKMEFIIKRLTEAIFRTNLQDLTIAVSPNEINYPFGRCFLRQMTCVMATMIQMNVESTLLHLSSRRA